MDTGMVIPSSFGIVWDFTPLNTSTSSIQRQEKYLFHCFPAVGGRALRRGREIAICNSWSKIEPPIFFSLAREKKTGRSRSKRKERL
jgi:hypothetical protein